MKGGKKGGKKKMKGKERRKEKNERKRKRERKREIVCVLGSDEVDVKEKSSSVIEITRIPISLVSLT